MPIPCRDRGSLRRCGWNVNLADGRTDAEAGQLVDLRIGEIGQSADVLRPILDALPVVAVKDTAHFL